MFKLKISTQDRLVIEHIQQLIKMDAECDVLMKEVFLNVYIESVENEAEIMLRFNEHVGTIIIARIHLMKQRQGGLTKILKVLEDYIATHPNYHTIEFESVLTPEMQQYCLKNGYTKVQWSPFNFQKNCKPVLEKLLESNK